MSVEVEREMLNAIFAARDEEYADAAAPQHCKTVLEKCGN